MNKYVATKCRPDPATPKRCYMIVKLRDPSRGYDGYTLLGDEPDDAAELELIGGSACPFTIEDAQTSVALLDARG